MTYNACTFQIKQNNTITKEFVPKSQISTTQINISLSIKLKSQIIKICQNQYHKVLVLTVMIKKIS